MIAYHGSNHNFKTLRIRKDLTRKASVDNEGYGIYFSTDKSVALSYGKYLYTLEINDSVLCDMRSVRVCMAYVKSLENDLYKCYGVRLSRYTDLPMVARYLAEGRVAISGIGREIHNILDSVYNFYMDYGTRCESIWRFLESWNGIPKAYMFTYRIKDSGIIRDVSPDVVRIVSKERV